MRCFNYIVFTCLVLLNFGCSKKEAGIKSDVTVLGHGGVGFDSYFNQLPPNSYSSIDKAIDGLNADGVDIDIQMDANQVLWLFHDSRLEECTNCSGCIGELSTEYVGECAFNKNIDQAYVNKCKIQRLEEIIKKYAAYKIKPTLFLDVITNKKCSDVFKLGDELDRMISKYDAYTWTEINSDMIELLVHLRKKSPKHRLYFETVEVDKGIQDCLKDSLNGITARHYRVSAEQIQLCHENKLKVTLHSMHGYNDLVDALKKQADQVITDNIELVFRIIDRK